MYILYALELKRTHYTSLLRGPLDALKKNNNKNKKMARLFVFLSPDVFLTHLKCSHLLSKNHADLVADKYTFSQTSCGTENIHISAQTQIHQHTPNT